MLPKVVFCHNIALYIQIEGNVLRGITLDKIIRWMVKQLKRTADFIFCFHGRMKINFKGPLLCEKSTEHNRLIICTSPVGSEASHAVSVNSHNKLLRISSDKNCTICSM
jgi:hypothetical protein